MKFIQGFFQVLILVFATVASISLMYQGVLLMVGPNSSSVAGLALIVVGLVLALGTGSRIAHSIYPVK